MLKHMETLHTFTGKLEQDLLAGSWATIEYNICYSVISYVFNIENQTECIDNHF